MHVHRPSISDRENQMIRCSFFTCLVCCFWTIKQNILDGFLFCFYLPKKNHFSYSFSISNLFNFFVNLFWFFYLWKLPLSRTRKSTCKLSTMPRVNKFDEKWKWNVLPPKKTRKMFRKMKRITGKLRTQQTTPTTMQHP